MRPGFEKQLPYMRNNTADSWRPDYPNSPDLRFNYYKLLNDGQMRPSAKSIGQASGNKTIAIIGAGAAGMTAAREAWRCGFKVRIYEASPRIGGRLYTRHKTGGLTSFELGAMRVPFFNNQGGGQSAAHSTNSVMAYYMNRDQRWESNPHLTFGVFDKFPNPGQTGGGTGIYINDGHGPNGEYSTPTLIDWPAGGQPDNQTLQAVGRKVGDFITLFTNTVSPVYVEQGDRWSTLWNSIANNYDKMSFSDLVLARKIETYDNDGWFGGLGMTPQEADLFYTIGSGDGSWGAFYSVSSMWFIRCVMFGYNSDLQQITGLNGADSLPQYGRATFDSAETRISPPLYRGVQSLVELLYYLQPPGAEKSLYTACADKNDATAALYVNSTVTGLKRLVNGQIEVRVNNAAEAAATVDYAILTPQLWATQRSIDMQGFDQQTMLPHNVRTAIKEQHIIASAKIFFPLTEAYWLSDRALPQILVTDTFVQDAYGMQWSSQPDDAALLASYTWEDDAIKLLAETDETKLAGKVLDKLDDIFKTTLNKRITPYVNLSEAFTFQWTTQPNYHGCAKLYRQRSWERCYALLTYNRAHSAQSNLYFAGETYGVEGGWTEPALRTALDAVIHIIHNSEGLFNGGFSYADYPTYDMTFSPDETYPQTAGIQTPPLGQGLAGRGNDFVRDSAK